MVNQIKNFFKKKNVNVEIEVLDDSTRSSADAAKALRCDQGQIAKSIILTKVESNSPILVVASGKHKIPLKKISNLIDSEVKLASPDYVFESTGYKVGGVPPVTHTDIKIFFDKTLLDYKYIWAAAGSSHSVFKISPELLKDLIEAEVIGF